MIEDNQINTSARDKTYRIQPKLSRQALKPLFLPPVPPEKLFWLFLPLDFMFPISSLSSVENNIAQLDYCLLNTVFSESSSLCLIRSFFYSKPTMASQLTQSQSHKSYKGRDNLPLSFFSDLMSYCSSQFILLQPFGPPCYSRTHCVCFSLRGC